MTKPSTAARSLTSRLLINHFRRLRTRYCFTHLEAYLFFELVACCQQEGWPAECYLSNALLAGAVGCSERGLIQARQNLAVAGLLTYESGSRRTPTAYHLLLPAEAAAPTFSA